MEDDHPRGGQLIVRKLNVVRYSKKLELFESGSEDRYPQRSGPDSVADEGKKRRF